MNIKEKLTIRKKNYTLLAEESGVEMYNEIKHDFKDVGSFQAEKSPYISNRSFRLCFFSKFFVY